MPTSLSLKILSYMLTGPGYEVRFFFFRRKRKSKKKKIFATEVKAKGRKHQTLSSHTHTHIAQSVFNIQVTSQRVAMEIDIMYYKIKDVEAKWRHVFLILVARGADLREKKKEINCVKKKN